MLSPSTVKRHQAEKYLQVRFGIPISQLNDNSKALIKNARLSIVHDYLSKCNEEFSSIVACPEQPGFPKGVLINTINHRLGERAKTFEITDPSNHQQPALSTTRKTGNVCCYLFTLLLSVVSAVALRTYSWSKET